MNNDNKRSNENNTNNKRLYDNNTNNNNKRSRSNNNNEDKENNNRNQNFKYGEFVNGKYKRYDTSKHCWTHGGCDHAGKDCPLKQDKHKDHATFATKLGGSKQFCPKT